MIPERVIQNSLDDVWAVARIKMYVFNRAGKTIASTVETEDMLPRDVQKAFWESEADSQSMQNYQLFKIYEEKDRTTLVLAAHGEGQEAYTFGKLVARQIQALLLAYVKSADMDSVLQTLLLNRVKTEDIYQYAADLCVEREALRVAFLIEADKQDGRIILSFLEKLFADSPGILMTLAGNNEVVLLKELKSSEKTELDHVAFMLVDMLNAELMVGARVSYGNVFFHLEEATESFREARMAMEVGKIFYANKRILSYSSMGIGGLIYQMPKALCEKYLKEIFKESPKDILDGEMLDIVHKFLGNNLNLSETARQLYLHRNTLVYRLGKLQKATGLDIRNFDDALALRMALMVLDYLNYQKEE